MGIKRLESKVLLVLNVCLFAPSEEPYIQKQAKPRVRLVCGNGMDLGGFGFQIHSNPMFGLSDCTDLKSWDSIEILQT